MNNLNSLEKLAKYFCSLENEFNLINYEINGIKVWQYQRFRIFNEIAVLTNMYKRAHTKKVGLFDILKASPSLLYYSIFSNPLIGNYKRDYLIFGSGRKTNVNGRLVDIYAKYFIEKEHLKNYEIIEELIENQHLTKEKKNRKHQDYQQIRTFILSKLNFFTFNKEQKNFINKIENKIIHDLNISIDLSWLLKIGYLNFKYDYSFYNKLLQKRNPKKIYLVCSYTYKKALIAAAKNLEIETIELQHGTIDKLHMGYSYPGQNEIEYFPDKLYLFGQYWKETLQYPIENEKLVIKGFPYFNFQKKYYENIQKKTNQLLIISQGTIGKKLSEIICNEENLLKDFNVIYKLHPGEYARWKSEYPCLEKLARLKNIHIIDNNDINIYEYFASSPYVIGIYSTAIYEALSFNCKVVLMDLPGVEYMAELVNKNITGLAESLNEAINYFENSSSINYSSDYFFSEQN